MGDEAIKVTLSGIRRSIGSAHIAESWLTDDLVPSGHGELAGDQRGGAAMAILDDLHEIAPLAG